MADQIARSSLESLKGLNSHLKEGLAEIDGYLDTSSKRIALAQETKAELLELISETEEALVRYSTYEVVEDNETT